MTTTSDVPVEIGVATKESVFAAPAAILLGNLSRWFATQGFTGSKSFAMAASSVSAVYIIGFIALLFAPETKGKGLPDDSVFETPAGTEKA